MLTVISLQAIFIFLSITSKLYVWYILLGINTIFFILIAWKIFLITIPIIILFFGIRFHLDKTNILGNNIDMNFVVSKKITSGVYANSNLINVYIPTYENYENGDVINVKSNKVELINNSTNFDRYLKSEGLKYKIVNPTIKFLYNQKNIKNIIQNYFIRGPSFYTRYVPLILLGQRNPKNEIIVNKIKNISILHLFTISGFHINILIIIFNKILLLFKVKNKLILLLPILIIFPYILIIGVPIAATRAFVFSILCSINKIFLKNKFHKLNLLSFTMLLFFFINPYVVYSYSFIFTFLLTYSITLVSTSLNKRNKKAKIILVAWFLSMLINLKINEELNFTSILSSLFFTPLISFSYIMTFIFFWHKSAIDNYYLLIDILLNFFQVLKLSINCYLESNAIILITSISFAFLLCCIKKPPSAIV